MLTASMSDSSSRGQTQRPRPHCWGTNPVLSWGITEISWARHMCEPRHSQHSTHTHTYSHAHTHTQHKVLGRGLVFQQDGAVVRTSFACAVLPLMTSGPFHSVKWVLWPLWAAPSRSQAEKYKQNTEMQKPRLRRHHCHFQQEARYSPHSHTSPFFSLPAV